MSYAEIVVEAEVASQSKTIEKKPRFNKRRRVILGALAIVSLEVLSACDPTQAAGDLDATYNARQCIIDNESRQAGVYTAEWRPARGHRDTSTASGAYQYLDSAWQINWPLAQDYYQMSLFTPQDLANGADRHAAYAPPYVQDLVAAYDLSQRPLHQHPWRGADEKCWGMIGTAPEIRIDTPPVPPPDYIQQQIDAYIQTHTPAAASTMENIALRQEALQ